MKFLIFNLMAAAAVVYLAAGTPTRSADEIWSRVTATVQKVVAEARQIADQASRKSEHDVVPAPVPTPATSTPVVAEKQEVSSPVVSRPLAAIVSPASSSPPDASPQVEAAGTKSGAKESTVVAPKPATPVPEKGIAAPKSVAALDPAAAKRRAEVLGEGQAAPGGARSAPDAQKSNGFMSRSDRARELRRLAEDMEYLFVEKVISR